MATIVQGLWIGNKLSITEKLCIKSFLDHGNVFHLYTYSDIEGVPEGTIIKDANEIIPSSKIFTYHNGSYAGFADWFRQELVLKTGEFYVDMDIICLKKFDFEKKIVFGLENGEHANSAVMRFPKNHELIKHISYNTQHPNTLLPYDSKRKKLKKIIRKYFQGNKMSNIDWGETGGPDGFTNALKYFGLFDKALPHIAFFPISWQNWNTVFDNTYFENPDYLKGSYALHLWNECLRKDKSFDIKKDFHPNSLFARLLKKHNMLEHVFEES